MEELADALIHAVEHRGVDEASFTLAPTLPRTPADVTLWRRTLERTDPDAVVLLIGGWERLEVLGELATGARTEPGTYRAEVVDPAVELVRDAGAELFWVSPVPVRDAEKSAFVAELAEDWRTAVDEVDGATYVDVTPVIAPDGYATWLEAPDGRRVRVRRRDGIHLCPDGQALVAAAVVLHLGPVLSEVPEPDWAQRWREGVDEPGGCAPYERQAR